MHNQRIVVFTGAGISAESGLGTFRNSGGLWEKFSIDEVATPQSWKADPQKVLDFYNDRRRQVRHAQPNPAHLALAELAKHYLVSIITQNIDDLHERVGSTNVLHLHGEIMKARSTQDPRLIYDLGNRDIAIGDLCELGSQLRPHLVWFHEDVPEFPKAAELAGKADVLLVVGTSLAVYPAASLIEYVLPETPILVISPELESEPGNMTWFKEKAATKVPELVKSWIEKGIPS